MSEEWNTARLLIHVQFCFKLIKMNLKCELSICSFLRSQSTDGDVCLGSVCLLYDQGALPVCPPSIGSLSPVRFCSYDPFSFSPISFKIKNCCYNLGASPLHADLHSKKKITCVKKCFLSLYLRVLSHLQIIKVFYVLGVSLTFVSLLMYLCPWNQCCHLQLLENKCFIV